MSTEGRHQTALFEAHKKNPEKIRDVLVLGRIYETRTRDITSEIAEATNSQTPINTRDLHSNDDIQKKLEESFLDQGLFYERKLRQHTGQSKKKRIDALAAGQTYLAYAGGLPEVAKKDRGRVFRDLYQNVFNEDRTTQQLLVPFRLYEVIQDKKRELQKKIRNGEKVDSSLLYLIDGGYHVLFAVHELCEANGTDPFNQAKAEMQIPVAINILAILVGDEMNTNETFTTNRYFKDAKTKGIVQRAVVLKASKKMKARTKASSARPKPRKRVTRHW